MPDSEGPAPHLLGPQGVQLPLQPGAQSPLHLLPLLAGGLQLGQGLLQLLNLLHVCLLLSELSGGGEEKGTRNLDSDRSEDSFKGIFFSAD